MTDSKPGYRNMLKPEFEIGDLTRAKDESTWHLWTPRLIGIPPLDTPMGWHRWLVMIGAPDVKFLKKDVWETYSYYRRSRGNPKFKYKTMEMFCRNMQLACLLECARLIGTGPTKWLADADDVGWTKEITVRDFPDATPQQAISKLTHTERVNAVKPGDQLLIGITPEKLCNVYTVPDVAAEPEGVRRFNMPIGVDIALLMETYDWQRVKGKTFLPEAEIVDVDFGENLPSECRVLTP